MWLGEQITLRGIGNGISLIIFSGIVAEIPRALASTFELGRTGALSANDCWDICFSNFYCSFYSIF
jgi:preprotein translocase subunit SecY